MTLYNFGRRSVDMIKVIHSGRGTMIHGNTGKRIVREDKEEVYNETKERLTIAESTQSSPFVTRIVRDASGASST